MTDPSIQPTVTQQVRCFLTDQGVDLAPWSGLDETYGELYALLNLRRDDPQFWPPVTRLLDGIVRGAIDPEGPDRLPAPQAELLASWDVEELVDELRQALPGGEPPRDPSAVRRFASGLSGAVMGGFLLLGLAAAAPGCSNDDLEKEEAAAQGVDAAAESGAAADGGAVPDHGPWFEKCNLDSSSVLWSTLDRAEKLSWPAKSGLCRCFVGLNQSWSTGLNELFTKGTAKEIADALTHMLRCCHSQNAKHLGSDFAKVKADFLKQQLCGGVPIYKGVTFPDDRTS